MGDSMVTGGFMGITAPDWIASNVMKDRNREDAEIAFNRSSAYQTEMSNTAWQRGVADMKAAGINPMLAVQQGPASTPTPNMPLPHSSLVTGSTSVSAQQQTAAQVDLTRALADKTGAEAQEVRERTPTHSVSIDKMKQEIGESAMRIEKIIAETDTQHATAAHINQQRENLREAIPQIRQTVDMLRAQTGETWNRAKANLPELQKNLLHLEGIYKAMEMPGRQTDEAYSSSRAGTVLRAIGNALRSLNPLLPSTSSSSVTHERK